MAPRIELESYDGRQRQVFRIPRRPRTVHHILRAELTCGRTINPTFLGLDKLTDSEFIYSLANELDAAVVRALDIARRIGWNKIHLRLRRVYHVPRLQRREGTHEPDEVDRSIASAIKLLHAVVSRLAEVDTLAARRLVTRWKWVESSIHLRLWAAMSRDARITPANEVADFLLRLDSKPFWDVHHHPEIAELRAARFMEFGNCPSKKITKRIRKGPPRRFWPRDAEAERINEGRLYWSLRELKRIEIFGVLPSRDKMWLEENIDRFEDLAEMNRLDEGFLDFPKGGVVPPNPDRSLDFRQGVDRLRSLEEAFSGSRSGWRNLPGDRARDWLTEGGNALQVLEDLKSCADAGAEFKGVWECFGWAHSPQGERERECDECGLGSQANQVVELLGRVPRETMSAAIEGISHWLGLWRDYVVEVPNWASIWCRAWDLAIEETNSMEVPEEGADLEDLALNTCVGRLVGVFLTGCPDLSRGPRPFDCDGDLRRIRSELVKACGLSGFDRETSNDLPPGLFPEGRRGVD